MKLSRRDFIHAGCTAATAVLFADISDHSNAQILQAGLGSSPQSFNGGKTQVQSWDISYSGDYPFIDLMKTATSWNYGDNTGEPGPSELDANGWPAVARASGYYVQINIPPRTRPGSGRYVLKGVGTHRGSVTIQNTGGGAVGTFNFSTGTERYTFTTSDPLALLVYVSPRSNNPLPIQIYYLDDETAFNAGEIFGSRFLQVLRQGKPGVIRFLDWARANTSGITTWATRKSVSYYSYGSFQYVPSLDAGTTTTSSNSRYGFSLSFGRGGPVDKQKLHVKFSGYPVSISIGPNARVTWNAGDHGLAVGQPFCFVGGPGIAMPAPIDASTFNNQKYYYVTSVPTTNTFTFSATKGGANVDTTGGAPRGVPTVVLSCLPATVGYDNSGVADVVTWPNHGLVPGDMVSITSRASYGMPLPLSNNVTYYFVLSTGFTAGSFQFSRTPEGVAISTNRNKYSGTIEACPIQTLSLNGSPAAPIANPYGDTLSSMSAVFGGKVATLTYDAALGVWLACGGNGYGNVGIENGVPPEVMVELCAKIGAHPHFVAPFLAVDPMTDWHKQLASYVKNSGPSWMKPRFEGSNECWNFGGGFYATRYAWNKSVLYWGRNFALQQMDWYGMTMSKIGQDVNSIYGGTPSTQTNYAIICAVQVGTADNFTRNNPNNPRLTSAQYVSAGPAQRGYLQEPAYNWVTHSCFANYTNPACGDRPLELYLAYQWNVANLGDSAAQATNIQSAYDTSYAQTTSIFTGQITSNVLTVKNFNSAMIGGRRLAIGQIIFFNNTQTTITSFGSGSGGDGTYNVASTPDVGQASMFGGGAVGSLPVGPCQSREFGLAYMKLYETNTREWASNIPGGAGKVTKLTCYEGGLSPTYPQPSQGYSYPANECAYSNITSISATGGPVTVNVGSFINTAFGPPVNGNPAAIGMPIMLVGVGGTPSLANAVPGACKLTAGSPGNVQFNNHGLAPGMAVYFTPQTTNDFLSTLPAGVNIGQPYYVKTVIDGNNFTIAAASGGAAVAMTGLQFTNFYCVPCYVVTAVSGNAVTLNISGTGTYAGGQLHYGCASANICLFNRALKSAPQAQAYITSMLSDLELNGGEFGSCYFLSGARTPWGVWDPNIYLSSTPPQWAAIEAFNTP
jgi:hypothetical protein